MAKIMNIGVLDVSEIKEDLAKEITELKNIGLLVESDNSQVLLKDAKKANIGSTLKLPSDMKVDFILKNGSVEINQDFLEGVTTPLVMLVNGKIIFDEDIDTELLDKKLFKLLLNGHLICPSKLKGLIESRSVINGSSSYFKKGFRYIGEDIQINNTFLKGIKANSKLAVSKLIAIDELNMELFEKKIESIQVLEKLVLIEKNEDILPYIEDNFNVGTVVISNGQNKVKYYDDNIIIDSNNIQSYNKDVIFVEGDVELYLDEGYPISDYISQLICDTVICNEKTYPGIEGLLGEGVKVQLIKGKLITNKSKMELAREIKEITTIKNMGKLIINEHMNIDSFKDNVFEIVNYGVIEVPNELIDLVQEKVKKNYGHIRQLEDKTKEKDKEEEDTDILYANIGELKL